MMPKVGIVHGSVAAASARPSSRPLAERRCPSTARGACPSRRCAQATWGGHGRQLFDSSLQSCPAEFPQLVKLSSKLSVYTLGKPVTKQRYAWLGNFKSCFHSGSCALGSV